MSNNDRYRRFNLRIPKETFERLQEAADARSHSMNAEIVQRLEESFSQSSSHPSGQEYNLSLLKFWPSKDDLGEFFILSNARYAKKKFIEKLENYRAIKNGLKTDEFEREIARRELKSARISYLHALETTRALDIFNEDLLIAADEIKIEDEEQ